MRPMYDLNYDSGRVGASICGVGVGKRTRPDDKGIRGVGEVIRVSDNNKMEG